MMRTIAFDPSYNTTGFAVVEGPRLVAYGTIKSRGECSSEKYASIMHQVGDLCRQHEVVKAVVEIPPHFSYGRSTGDHGQQKNLASIQKCSNAAAVILGELGKIGIRAVEIDAHKWKMVRGQNLNKKHMIAMARRLFPQLREVALNDHEAEAVSMAVLNC